MRQPILPILQVASILINGDRRYWYTQVKEATIPHHIGFQLEVGVQPALDDKQQELQQAWWPGSTPQSRFSLLMRRKVQNNGRQPECHFVLTIFFKSTQVDDLVSSHQEPVWAGRAVDAVELRDVEMERDGLARQHDDGVHRVDS